MDTALHYIEAGSGDPLILLHGNGEDASYFDGQMNVLSSFFRVIAPDTRGHGRSPRGTAPFTIRQFADDLLAFMDRLGIQKAHLLGFSDGGNIALIFALRYPQRVDRLILDGANLYPSGVRPSVQLPVTLRYHAARLCSRFSDGARRRAELLGLMVNDPNIRPEELRALAMPALVMAGTQDMIRDKHTRLICASLPNARLALIPGGHFIARTAPDLFNQTVLDFLLAGTVH